MTKTDPTIVEESSIFQKPMAFAKVSVEAPIRFLGPEPKFNDFWITLPELATDRCCDLMVVVKPRTAVNALKLGARQHKKRRNQTLAYHKRVQKKWTKRFLKGDPKFVIAEGPPVVVSFDLDALSSSLKDWQ